MRITVTQIIAEQYVSKMHYKNVHTLVDMYGLMFWPET